MVTESTYVNKALIASSNFGPVRKTETIAAGSDLVAGTILGRITANGKLAAYASGNIDGSENPVAVLLVDAAAASADVEAICGFAGAYKETNMTGLDAAAKTALEGRAVYFL